MAQKTPLEISNEFRTAFESVNTEFYKSFGDRANQAALEFHCKEAIKGRFDVPAHTYANLYLMAVATAQSPQVLSCILEGWKDEIARQGKVLDWRQIQKDVYNVCRDILNVNPDIAA